MMCNDLPAGMPAALAATGSRLVVLLDDAVEREEAFDLAEELLKRWQEAQREVPVPPR